MLTKFDIAAIRKADDITVHLSVRHPEGLVRLIKRKRHADGPFAQDMEHVLPAKAEIETIHGRAELESGRAQFFAMAYIYHDQHGQVSLALKSLRVGDELTFSFYPDAWTNQYAARERLHGDLLLMKVRRKGKTIARWEIAHSVCPDNSARMCQGVLPSDWYERAAERGDRAAKLA